MLVILIIPLLFSSFFYTYTLNFALNKIEEKSYANISSVKDIVDRDLLYVQKTAFQIIQESNLVKVAEKDSSKIALQKLQQLTNYFSNEINSSDFIKNIYVYYHDNDIIISADGKYNAKDFHKVYVKNMKFSTWQTKIKQTYFNDFMTKEESISIPDADVIEYRQSFPLTGDKNGTLVILLDIAELEKIFVSQSHAPDSAIYILNGNNDVLFHAGQSYSLAESVDKSPENFTIYTDENFLLCRRISDETSLQYISIENKNTMLKNFHKISYWIVLYIVFVIFAGTLYIFFISKKAYKPIDKVRSMLNAENNEISWPTIHMYLENLKATNQRAENLLTEQRSSLKKQFLEKLLAGNVPDKLLEEECHLHNIFLNKDSFLTIVSSFNSVPKDECSIIKVAITNIMEDLAKEKANVYAIDTGIHQITFLINFDSSLFPDDEIVSCCQFLNACVKEEFEHDILFDMGTIEHSADRIYISVQKAKESYESRIMHEDHSVIFSVHNRHHSDPSFYSLEQENKLINYVMSGQKESAISYLDELFTEFSDSSLPMLKYFFFGISGTAHKLINLLEENSNQIFTDINLEDVLHFQNLNELKRVLEKAIDISCDEIATKKNKKHQVMSNRMLEYIDNHSSEYDMSLDKVAHHFNLSPTYVSRFFKEQIHENFSTYLTKIRIDKAKRLLKETTLDINEIASKVGYSASTVFIKNFKKLEQMTPGTYRNKSKAE